MIGMSWDIGFRKATRKSSDDRNLDEDYLEYIIVEEENQYLDEVEEMFKPMLKGLNRVNRDIDLDIKETARRVKMLAIDAAKIKGGVENEIGMRNIKTTLTKMKLDIIKEQCSITKTIEDIKLKRLNATGVTTETGNNMLQSAKTIAYTHRNRAEGTTINRGIFDTKSEPKEELSSSEMIGFESLPQKDIVDDEPNVEYKPIGKVDYSYGARNMILNRQCTAQDNRVKIVNVMYYDRKAKQFWVSQEDENGNTLQGQDKPLSYFLEAEVDWPNMMAEDSAGTRYEVRDASVDDMPERYKKEWEIMIEE